MQPRRDSSKSRPSSARNLSICSSRTASHQRRRKILSTSRLLESRLITSPVTRACGDTQKSCKPAGTRAWIFVIRGAASYLDSAVQLESAYPDGEADYRKHREEGRPPPEHWPVERRSQEWIDDELAQYQRLGEKAQIAERDERFLALSRDMVVVVLGIAAHPQWRKRPPHDEKQHKVGKNEQIEGTDRRLEIRPVFLHGWLPEPIATVRCEEL